MFKEPYNVDNYINFLFYGIDMESKFYKTELPTIYKNKYERLSKTLPTNTHTINTAYLIIDNFISILKNHYPKYLNDDRIRLFKNCYNQHSHDKLIFNSILSLSFIEIETDDDDLWEDIVTNVNYFCNEFIDYISDDSKQIHKILTISIPVIDYVYCSNIPDITDYNPTVSLSYYEIADNIPTIDNSIKDVFTSELKYLINENRINKDKLFTDLLNKCMSLDIYEVELSDIRNTCKELISYIKNNNLYLLVHLQFRMLENIFNSNLYCDTDYESILIKKLLSVIAIDIAVYNNSLNIDNESIKSLLLAYNYCIITIQDMIDHVGDDLDGKKIFMFTYKSQLFKSRNKIQERMNNICRE